MALSRGQINDAFREALGRMPTDQEANAASSRGDLDGDPGKFALIAELGGNPESVTDSIFRTADSVIDEFKKAGERSGQFDKDSPFSFDEALAQASAKERFDPFFEAELGEFTTGIDRQRARSEQDESALRQELTTRTEDFVGRAKRQLDEAIDSSREGFAGAGLLRSGQRLRREGQLKIESGEQAGEFLRGQGLRERESRLRQERLGEDIGLRRKTFERTQGAARETALQVDVQQQKREQQQQRELARQQVVGFPLTTGSQSLSSIFGL